jgi:hypothetical protein
MIMVYSISAADCKSSDILASSTGTNPDGWREFWRTHGTSWRSLFELHAAIVNRLQAASSSWSLS